VASKEEGLRPLFLFLSITDVVVGRLQSIATKEGAAYYRYTFIYTKSEQSQNMRNYSKFAGEMLPIAGTIVIVTREGGIHKRTLYRVPFERALFSADGIVQLLQHRDKDDVRVPNQYIATVNGKRVPDHRFNFHIGRVKQTRKLYATT